MTLPSMPADGSIDVGGGLDEAAVMRHDVVAERARSLVANWMGLYSCGSLVNGKNTWLPRMPQHGFVAVELFAVDRRRRRSQIRSAAAPRAARGRGHRRASAYRGRAAARAAAPASSAIGISELARQLIGFVALLLFVLLLVLLGLLVGQIVGRAAWQSGRSRGGSFWFGSSRSGSLLPGNWLGLGSPGTARDALFSVRRAYSARRETARV